MPSDGPSKVLPAQSTKDSNWKKLQNFGVWWFQVHRKILVSSKKTQTPRQTLEREKVGRKPPARDGEAKVFSLNHGYLYPTIGCVSATIGCISGTILLLPKHLQNALEFKDPAAVSLSPVPVSSLLIGRCFHLLPSFEMEIFISRVFFPVPRPRWFALRRLDVWSSA